MNIISKVNNFRGVLNCPDVMITIKKDAGSAAFAVRATVADIIYLLSVPQGRRDPQDLQGLREELDRQVLREKLVPRDPRGQQEQ